MTTQAESLRAAATAWHDAFRDGLLKGVSSCACARGTGEMCGLGAALTPPTEGLDARTLNEATRRIRALPKVHGPGIAIGDEALSEREAIADFLDEMAGDDFTAGAYERAETMPVEEVRRRFPLAVEAAAPPAEGPCPDCRESASGVCTMHNGSAALTPPTEGLDAWARLRAEIEVELAVVDESDSFQAGAAAAYNFVLSHFPAAESPAEKT